VVRESLYLRDPIRNGDGPFCPRCDRQIVVHEGHFVCSCGYDNEAWAEDLGYGHPSQMLVAATLRAMDRVDG
jgi:hypothetical protein